jgi:hypothetical protein
MQRCNLYSTYGVVEHLNENGSTAVHCALDVSKAFDKVNHFGLYIKLMDRGIPKLFLDILSFWYSKCFESGVVSSPSSFTY